MAVTQIDDYLIITGTIDTDVDTYGGDQTHGWYSLRLKPTAVATSLQSGNVPCEYGRPHKLRVWLQADSIAAGRTITVSARAIRQAKALGSTFYAINAGLLPSTGTWHLYEVDLTDSLARGYRLSISKAAQAFTVLVGLAEIVPMAKSFEAYLSADYAIPNGGGVVQFNSEVHDHFSVFDTANYRWVCPADGLWLLEASVTLGESLAAGAYYYIELYKNGSAFRARGAQGNAITSEFVTCPITKVARFAKGDLVTVYFGHSHGSSRTALATTCHFGGHEILGA